MARKSSALGGVALVFVVVLGLMAKYAKELLIVAGLVVGLWILYRLFFSKKAGAPPIPAPDSDASPLQSQVRQSAAASTRLPPSRPSASSQVRERADVHAASSRSSSTDGDAFWLPRTRSVTLAGRTLGSGIYVGTGLQAVQLGFAEPALVDPKLPVDGSVRDCSVRRLNYWPSYSDATPAARAAYLNWLDSGRKDPSADIGYVFLYFYGLERRALHDASISPTAEAELSEIQDEIARLLAIYGSNGSFQMYAGSLLDLLKYKVVKSGGYKSPPPPLRANNTLSLDHRIALAQCANDGSPLPGEWAFAWFLSDPTTRLRTPAVRCPTQFKELFLSRYAEVFGSGLVLSKNKTQLKMERRPASRTFGYGATAHTLSFDLPDVTVLTSPVRKLQDVAESCYPKLEGYSRLIGKDASLAGSFDGMLELPLSLWPQQYRRVIENIRKVVTESKRPVAVPLAKFKSWFPEWQTMTRPKLASLARVMSEAGLGMEPDVRFGGSVPNAGSTVVFFADDGASLGTSPSARYRAAALTLQLGAAVAMADGTPGDAEKAMMTRQLEEWLHLSASERARLRACTRLILAAPPKLTGVKSKVESLDTAQREAIGEFLTLIAQADAVVTTSEVKNIEKSFRLLGLDPKSVYSKLHVAATEPVTVASAGGEVGHRIPEPPQAQSSAGIALDPHKIAALQQDTERVSAILGAIFADDNVASEPDAAVAPEEPIAAPIPGLLGLRLGDSTFVQTLLSRQHWTRAELEELAEDRGFMLDGVLERINDASFDKYDKSLLEGDDPVDINPEVARELLQ